MGVLLYVVPLWECKKVQNKRKVNSGTYCNLLCRSVIDRYLNAQLVMRIKSMTQYDIIKNLCNGLQFERPWIQQDREKGPVGKELFYFVLVVPGWIVCIAAISIDSCIHLEG